MMKLLLALLVLTVTSKSQVDAFQCGQWWTNDCLFKDDKRYDSEASMDLIDQHMIWAHVGGYYIGDCYDHYGPQDAAAEPEQIDKEPKSAFPGWPYPEVRTIHRNILKSGALFVALIYVCIVSSLVSLCW